MNKVFLHYGMSVWDVRETKTYRPKYGLFKKVKDGWDSIWVIPRMSPTNRKFIVEPDWDLDDIPTHTLPVSK